MQRFLIILFWIAVSKATAQVDSEIEYTYKALNNDVLQSIHTLAEDTDHSQSPDETFEEYVWRKQQYCLLLHNMAGKHYWSKECTIVGKRLELIKKWKVKGEFHKQRAIKEGIFVKEYKELINLKKQNISQYEQFLREADSQAVKKVCLFLGNSGLQEVQDSLEVYIDLLEGKLNAQFLLGLQFNVQVEQDIIQPLDFSTYESFLNLADIYIFKLRLVVRIIVDCKYHSSSISFAGKQDEDKFMVLMSTTEWVDLESVETSLDVETVEESLNVFKLLAVSGFMNKTSVRSFSVNRPISLKENYQEIVAESLQLIKQSQVVDSKIIVDFKDQFHSSLPRRPALISSINLSYLDGSYRHQFSDQDGIKVLVQSKWDTQKVLNKIQDDSTVTPPVVDIKLSAGLRIGNIVKQNLLEIVKLTKQPTTKLIIQLLMNPRYDNGFIQDLKQAFHKSSLHRLEIRDLGSVRTGYTFRSTDVEDQVHIPRKSFKNHLARLFMCAGGCRPKLSYRDTQQ